MHEFVSLASRAPPTTKESNRNHTSVSIRPIAPRLARVSLVVITLDRRRAIRRARLDARTNARAKRCAITFDARIVVARVVVPRRRPSSVSRDARFGVFNPSRRRVDDDAREDEDEDEDEDAVKRCENMRTFSLCAYFVAATVRLSFQEPTKNEGEAIARAPSRRVVCVCDVDILGRCVHTLVCT